MFAGCWGRIGQNAYNDFGIPHLHPTTPHPVMNRILNFRLVSLLSALLIVSCSTPSTPDGPEGTTHDQLEGFFLDWRAFEAAPLSDGVPDYTLATMKAQQDELTVWQARLASFDTTGWSTTDRIDFEIIRAEMNGLDFDHRVRRPWERDPAFYVMVYPSPTDIPAREGPVIYTAIEWWEYQHPLTPDAAQDAAARLRTVQPLYEQAKQNLTGDARDLWEAGIRVIGRQRDTLEQIANVVGDESVRNAALEALGATAAFHEWLSDRLPEKQGLSGVGKENYTWYMNNVHLMPWSWEDEVAIMERELARSWAYLKLTEHRNRDLPELTPYANAAEYDAALNAAVDEYLAFLDDSDILTVAPWMDQALRERIGSFSPSDGPRRFFSEVNYRDGLVMRTHHYHWMDIARMANEPHGSIIRATPSLYNIFDGRAEGMATGMEEMMMAAGLFDDRPRARELVYILLAQRAARALGGLYMHGHEKTMLEASTFAVEWTPRGWMQPDGDLVQFEQHLYLQQPGYGSSYITGKIQIEDLIRDVARREGERFNLKSFMDRFNSAGFIPVALIRWEMTGKPQS